MDYNFKWQVAMEKICQQIELEYVDFDKDEFEWSDIYDNRLLLYCNYIEIYNILNKCYDQIIHPQKLIDIKKTLDIVILRLCQVKEELIILSNKHSDYIFMDQFLMLHNKTSTDINISLPLHVRYNKYCKEELLQQHHIKPEESNSFNPENHQNDNLLPNKKRKNKIADTYIEKYKHYSHISQQDHIKKNMYMKI